VSRLLFLLPSVPEPADAGAKLRNRGLLRLAGAEHAVDVLAFGRPDQGSALAALGQRTRVVPEPPGRSRWQRTNSLAVSDLPDMAHRLWSSDFAAAVQACGSYDAVQAEGIEMARYLNLVPARARIYDAHNPEFLLQRRASETAPSVVARAYSRVQLQRLERFERAVVRSSRMTLAVSEHDANQFVALAGQACVAVVPNGVDVAAYPFRAPQPGDQPNLLFLGKLDYRPNAEAIRWLIDHVMGRVFAALPTARLFAVGANPPAWLVAAGQHDPRIAVTGHVPDERPYLERCAVLLLPLRVAAGTRLKALVALASGLPVLSTAVGMEGLDARAGSEYLSAETAEQWVAAVQRLFAEPDLRAELARRGRTLVERDYDWAAIRPALQAAYALLAH
jgi:glycosyltransferase involved in cell wall biosynthesis